MCTRSCFCIEVGNFMMLGILSMDHCAWSVIEQLLKTYKEQDTPPPDVKTDYQLDGGEFGSFSLLSQQITRKENQLGCDSEDTTQFLEKECYHKISNDFTDQKEHTLKDIKIKSNISLNLKKLRTAVSKLKVAPSRVQQQGNFDDAQESPAKKKRYDTNQYSDISDCESEADHVVTRQSSAENGYHVLDCSDISSESDTEKSKSRPIFCYSDISNSDTEEGIPLHKDTYSKQHFEGDLGLEEVLIDLVSDSDNEINQPLSLCPNVLKEKKQREGAKSCKKKRRITEVQKCTGIKKRKEREHTFHTDWKDDCTFSKKRRKCAVEEDSDFECASPKKHLKAERNVSDQIVRTSLQHLLHSTDAPEDEEEEEEQTSVSSLRKFSTSSHQLLVSEPSIDANLGSDVQPKSFTSAQVHSIEACLEEGNSFNFHVTKMVEDFTTSRMRPSEKMVVDILKDILIISKDYTITSKAYKALKHVQTLHPPKRNIPFQWDHIEHILRCLSLPDSVNEQEPLSVASTALGLEIIVSYLEMELAQHNLSDQRDVKKSVVYRWLCAESNFQHVQQILAWLCSCFVLGEHDNVTASFSKYNVKREIALSEDDSSVCHKDVPEVLPLIQKLLSLSLSVTPHPIDSARKIAVELARNYIMQPSKETRHLLLSTICNHLLRLHVVQRILEDYCDGDYAIYMKNGHGSLLDMLECYKDCVPPPRATGNLTPPSSPGCSPTPEDQDHKPCPGHNTSDMEELVMLLFMLVESYVRIKKENIYMPIWARQSIISENTESEDRVTEVVQELRAKFSQRESGQTPRMEMYFDCIESIIETFCS
ncbi:uncharacterized protein LOC106163953 isoform X2 [Lingula anatina]|uniref:Uncharacterized protein LOC106163953 isoform X2 n=1 Tax=Lingula anatina TaxID=7574 RepID=A0A2R2MKL2_LINAN|nr:uncharacterized protein LOC106163953 isoform X2 [Lingula anatina]|eukprot:XP_023930607.1 uncharacterized protein LOC106163953 isoform X2 [Lingula anatina]